MSCQETLPDRITRSDVEHESLAGYLDVVATRDNDAERLLDVRVAVVIGAEDRYTVDDGFLARLCHSVEGHRLVVKDQPARKLRCPLQCRSVVHLLTVHVFKRERLQANAEGPLEEPGLRGSTRTLAYKQRRRRWTGSPG